MENDSKFYWLKLQKDFFKRHEIKVVESMPNGKDYILFYLKLLCESVSHEGSLRFSEEIPYDENMLAAITNTNVDIIRSAIKIFTSLNMIEILDDGTYFMNEVNKMIGSAANNDNANRQRRFRERKKQELLQERYDSVTKDNESIEIRDKSIDNNKKECIMNNTEEKDTEPMALSTSVDEITLEDIDVISWEEQAFNEFWKLYPKKVNKQGALRSFKRIKGLKKEYPLIIEAVKKSLMSKEWQKNNYQFVPHPQTWINQERWKDVVDMTLEQQIMSNYKVDDFWGSDNNA